MREFTGVRARIVTIIAVTMSLYHIFYVSHIFDALGIYIMALPHRSLSLTFLLSLCFICLPMRKSDQKRLPWYDVLFILIGVVGPLYIFFTWGTYFEKRYTYSDFYTYEIVFAIITVLATLEAARRAIGIIFPIVVTALLAYTAFGSHLSGPFHVPTVTLTEIINFLVYQDTGIFGIALGMASTVIIMFIIFSRFLLVTGGGEFFLNFAMSLMGHVRGGPAKVAVVSSALMGTITGGTAANVAATGTFTIPLMIRTGYKPEFAGGVEAVASNGGQIMPPVMGLVAFIMAEWIGVPYWDICVASFIPAMLYFIAVFVIVDGEAAKLSLYGLDRDDCPQVSKVLKDGWPFILPLLLLIYLLAVMRYSAQFAALYVIGLLLAVRSIKGTLGILAKRRTEIQVPVQSIRNQIVRQAVTPAYRTLISGLRQGGIGVIQAGVACACAGILIGTMSVTQFGLKLAEIMVALSGDSQFLLLILAAVTCFFLGMGMDAISAYIMVVLVVAPILKQFGVPALLAHLFVFWFSMVSYITPPVAIGAYVAAGIAGASPMKIGFHAAKLGFCMYPLPFMFLYKPALIIHGASISEIIVAILPALIGVFFVSWGLAGYALNKTKLLQRLLLLVGGALSIIMLDLNVAAIGMVLGSIALGWQAIEKRFRKRQLTYSTEDAVMKEAEVTQSKNTLLTPRRE